MTRFTRGVFVVEWSCLEVEGERTGSDAFDIYQNGISIGCVHMHREIDEDALLHIATLIDPARAPEEILGNVS